MRHFEFMVALLGVTVHCSQWSSAIVSVDISKPALQKCEDTLIGDWVKEIEIPGYRMSTREPLQFRVTEKCPTKLPHCLRECPRPMTKAVISLHPSNSTPDHTPDPIIHFTPYGYFRYENSYFSPEDFCIHSHPEDNLVIQLCPHSPKCGSGQEDHSNQFEVCIPKCCSIHKVIDLDTDACEYSSTKDPWTPLVYRSASRQICGEKRTDLKLRYIQSPPPCERFQKFLLKPIKGMTRVRFRLLTNGDLLLRDISDVDWTKLKKGTYCLDGVQYYGDDPKPYTGDPSDQILLHCLADNEEERNISGVAEFEENGLNTTGILYIVLLFSGVPFLLVTAIIYVLVWNKQNVHGWTIFSHTLAMLLHYLAQAVANTVSRILNSDQNGSSLCRFVGISNHFFVLASFCWLTMINYDLFSMFRHLQTTIGRSRGLKRFLVYMAIAWGIPFVAVLISVILDNLYDLYGDDSDCETDVIVPLYGHRTCYMVEEARPYYLYYPVGFLMALNLTLAAMTFVNMYEHNKSAKLAHGESRTKHRRKFSVMAKLAVVMGLVWVFDVIVFMGLKKEWETLPWYLVFPDVFNALQAVAIFVLFACQPKILNQVAEGYPCLRSTTEFLKTIPCDRKQGGESSTPTGTLDRVDSKRARLMKV